MQGGVRAAGFSFHVALSCLSRVLAGCFQVKESVKFGGMGRKLFTAKTVFPKEEKLI